MEPQYFIDGNLVTCTVFDESGLSFYASEIAVNNDLAAAMGKALEQAEKTRSEYKIKKED